MIRRGLVPGNEMLDHTPSFALNEETGNLSMEWINLSIEGKIMQIFPFKA